MAANTGTSVRSKNGLVRFFLSERSMISAAMRTEPMVSTPPAGHTPCENGRPVHRRHRLGGERAQVDGAAVEHRLDVLGRGHVLIEPHLAVGARADERAAGVDDQRVLAAVGQRQDEAHAEALAAARAGLHRLAEGGVLRGRGCVHLPVFIMPLVSLST